MKKLITCLLVGTIAVSCLAPCSLAAYEDEYKQPEIAEPRYEVIAYITASLTISSSGRANCGASAEVPPGYRIELLAELQQKKGNTWTTIHDWDSSGGDYAEISGPWYVMPGYSYRLKVTVTTYDSMGNFVEAPVEYSKVQEY